MRKYRRKSDVAAYDERKAARVAGMRPAELFAEIAGMEPSGPNVVGSGRRTSPLVLFLKAFINPFIGVLTLLAVVSLVIDVLMAPAGEQQWSGVVIIIVMVSVSVALRFWQEWKASEAVGSLLKMVRNTALVSREGREPEETDISLIVPGDIVYLAAGDMIPADVRILDAKDLGFQ